LCRNSVCRWDRNLEHGGGPALKELAFGEGKIRGCHKRRAPLLGSLLERKEEELVDGVVMGKDEALQQQRDALLPVKECPPTAEGRPVMGRCTSPNSRSEAVLVVIT